MNPTEKFPPRVWIMQTKGLGGERAICFTTSNEAGAYASALYPVYVPIYQAISLEEHNALLKEAKNLWLQRGILAWVTPQLAFGNKSPMECYIDGVDLNFILGTFTRMFNINFEMEKDKEARGK